MAIPEKIAIAGMPAPIWFARVAPAIKYQGTKAILMAALMLLIAAL